MSRIPQSSHLIYQPVLTRREAEAELALLERQLQSGELEDDPPDPMRRSVTCERIGALQKALDKPGEPGEELTIEDPRQTRSKELGRQDVLEKLSKTAPAAQA